MSYTLRLSDGTVLTELKDNTVDSTTAPISLIGRGTLNYGTLVAQNMLRMLENFSSTIAPSNPLVGQLWFDRTTNRMRVWEGDWISIDGDSTDQNVPNTNVKRDANGNFTANSITAASLHGTADTALRLIQPRLITFGGDVSGNLSFDGSRDVNMQMSVQRSATANRWTSPRVIRLTGCVTGLASFDGSTDLTVQVGPGTDSQQINQLQQQVTQLQAQMAAALARIAVLESKG